MIKLKSILVIIVALRVRVGSPVENTHCVIKINSTCGVLFYILEKKKKTYRGNDEIRRVRPSSGV